MAFNPNGVYLSCTDTLGNVYAWQNGVFYDKYGDSFTVLPASNRGQLSPSPLPLAQSGVAVSVTGTTAEVTLASVTIPGGLMGPNGSIRVTAQFTTTNNANSKNLFVRYGGVQAFLNTATTSLTYVIGTSIRNRNSLTSQVANQITAGPTALAAATLSVNSAVDQVLTISGACATSASDTITLEGYTVEVLSA